MYIYIYLYTRPSHSWRFTCCPEYFDLWFLLQHVWLVWDVSMRIGSEVQGMKIKNNQEFWI